jgi:hypothetical protein
MKNQGVKASWGLVGGKGGACEMIADGLTPKNSK